MHTRPIITLTTDFGLKDEYTGAIKGVLLSFLPDAQIIDITHAISPQDISGASLILARSCTFFPPATVHLAIVDPGVGSKRNLLAVKTSSYFFVGPDNGIFSNFLRQPEVQVHRIINHDLFLSPVSPTFHGRDIMAPVAAQLAGGLDINKVGPSVPVENCCIINLSSPVSSGNNLHGEILCRDHFGNLRTNISEQIFREFLAGGDFTLKIGDRKIKELCSNYAQTGPGQLIALIDSSGFLEIAIINGNAWQEINARVGEKVEISRGKTQKPLPNNVRSGCESQ